jgi:hypothetical protein
MAWDVFKGLVPQAFDLDIQTEERLMDVAVFRVDGTLKGLRKPADPAGPQSASSQGFRNAPIGSILSMAAGMKGLPMIDETGVKEKFDFEMSFVRDKPIEQQLRDTYGIRMTVEKRPMKFYKVKQRGG